MKFCAADGNRDSHPPARLGRICDTRLVDLGWYFIIVCLMFESFLSTILPIAGYLDEAVVLLLVVCSLASISVRRVDGNLLSVWEARAIICLAILTIGGLLGGLISGVQLSAMPVFQDVFTCMKYPAVLLSGYVVLHDKKRLYILLVNTFKVLLLVILPFAIVNQFVDIGMWFDVRYGLHSFQFVFGHPASFAAAIVGVLVLLLEDKKANGGWIWLCWLYLILSLRSTAIAFAVVSFLMCLMSDEDGRIGFARLLSFGLAALYLGWSQIEYYFITTQGSPRRLLLDVSFQIANRFFPLGSGFATYGSGVTAQPEYYSSLYSQYGFDGVYGLSRSYPDYLSDSFWPIVIGQFGWLGTILYLAALLFLFFGGYMRLRSNNQIVLPFLSGFVYLLLASISSSAFFHPMSIFIAICVALSVGAQSSCKQ